MGTRKLTDEEIERIANKQWKRQNLKHVTLEFEDGEDITKRPIIKRIGNLSGPKTIEGKKNSLKNLKVGSNPKAGRLPSHGGYVRKILDQEELEFYNHRKDKYLQEFDINESSDEILLNLILMDEVIIFRLLNRQAEKPSLNIDRPLSEAQKRLHKNLEGLAMLRKQRLSRDRMDKQMSIVRLASEVMKNKDAIQRQLELEEQEDMEFLRQKQKRDQEQYIDVEVSDIEDGDSYGEERKEE